MELAGQILTAVVEALPGIAVAIVIFFLARMLLRLFDPFFAQVQRGDMAVGWIDRYTVRATRGLVHIAIWLFALAMAYPYLPGAQTEAFKGISVVIGLMLSLGSSNVIGQAISGLIIIYSRTLHVGEYVRIGDVEGTVTETSTFAIRVRTGLGEELTLPNSLIVNQVTKNYSRTVKNEGYIVDTVMTIGYDTPWRQVHAMMIEGAKRTEGILDTPAPHVFQTALSDFYVEYRLVAQAIASAPRPRAQVMADLHAHLQDVFNENGVQIMSPHYFADPTHAKLVPPSGWNPPLAGKR
jgi:small-conductance mechanosensitive channel